MQLAVKNNKWLLPATIALLFFSIAYTVLSGNLLIMAAPFIVAYLFLVVVNWKNAYWLLLFCIPPSIQFTLFNNALSLSLPDEPICWLFLLLLILLVAYRPIIIPRWLLQQPITFIVILQLLWLVVAVLFSKVLILSIKFFIAKIWYLACFFILPVLVFKDKKDLKIGFLLILLPMLVTMMVIFVRHAALHFSFANIGAAIGMLYVNHVEYASVISMFFPVVCIAYPLTKNSKTWIRVSLLIIILFFVVSIFLTYARAALLALIFATIVGYAIKKRLVNFIMPAIYAVIVLTGVYLGQDKRYIDLRPDFEHTYMHSNYSSHLIATIQGRDLSSMERLYRWVAAIRMSADEPFTGYGPHGFYYHYKSYALPLFRTYVSKNEEHSTTHNYFLYMLTEQGWPAMILYAILIIVVFAQAQKIYHRFNDLFYQYVTLGLAMAFAVCFVNNFFSELIETHKVGTLFYLILALLVVLDKKSRDIKGTPAV